MKITFWLSSPDTDLIFDMTKKNLVSVGSKIKLTSRQKREKQSLQQQHRWTKRTWLFQILWFFLHVLKEPGNLPTVRRRQPFLFPVWRQEGFWIAWCPCTRNIALLFLLLQFSCFSLPHPQTDLATRKIFFPNAASWRSLQRLNNEEIYLGWDSCTTVDPEGRIIARLPEGQSSVKFSGNDRLSSLTSLGRQTAKRRGGCSCGAKSPRWTAKIKNHPRFSKKILKQKYLMECSLEL